MSLFTDTARADAWARKRYPGLSRRLIAEAFENRLILGPAGEALDKGSRVVEDSLHYEALEKALKELRHGHELEIPIVAETQDYLVVDKPAGVPSHPLHLRDTQTVTHWAFHRFPELEKEFPEIQPTLCPHRLDTGTSGILIVAKNKKSFETWRERFTEKALTKTYLAWCWGQPQNDTFLVDRPLNHCPGDRRKMHALGEEAALLGLGREARTEIQVVKKLSDRFLCRAYSKTGVTHQIRVHLSIKGYPLVGDRLYDPLVSSRPDSFTHHLLRAVILEGDGDRFTASEEAFTSLFS